MATKEELLNAMHYYKDLSTKEDLEYAYKIIVDAKCADSDIRDTLSAMYEHGPLFDGDVPSKSARNILVTDGYAARVVVNGEDGYNACTYKGRDLYKVLQAEKGQ